MEQLRQILSGIGAQLAKLSVTQRLLIAALCVVFVMTIFLVSQYAGSPKVVDLLPGGTGEDQQKAAAFLDQRGIPYTVKPDGKIAVPMDVRYTALGAMAKDQQLPGDKRLLFTGLASASGGGGNWMEPLADKQQKANIALQNELALVIANFPGVEKASVFISAPESRGLGAAARRPVAQVAIFPVKGQGLDQGTVNALADLVAGSVAGLDSKDVAVIDGTNRRSYRAVSPDDLAAGGGAPGGGNSYVEQVARVEQRVQQKLEEHLRFIPDVIVSVNAIVDAARRESVTTRVLNKGEGTVAIPSEETTSTMTSQSGGRGAAEPGVGANIAMDVNRAGGAGGGGGTNTSDEQSTVKTDVRFGESTTKQRDATGRPTKINVTVGVPREYVAEIVKMKKGAGAAGGAGDAAGGGAGGAGGGGEPTEAEIAAEFESAVRSTIETTLSPLIETDAGGLAPGAASPGQIVAGTVKAFLIPVAMTSMSGSGGGMGRAGGLMGGGGGGSGGGGGGMLGSLSGAMENSMIKTGVLGGLALVAFVLMFTMVRKAGKAAPLPTAEELVGIPPALEPGSDVVGEADEGATPMQGIEIDDTQLKTAKMLEEIGTLVKTNPQSAAGVLNRWLAPEE